MTDLIETYRGGVLIQECDAFGHLNIAYYVERFADAGHEWLHRLVPGTRWVTHKIATRYLSELRAGDPIAVAAGVIGIDAATATLGMVATNGMGGPVTTASEVVIALDAPDGETWAEARDAFAKHMVPWKEMPFEPVKLPDKPGPVATGLSRVKPGQADAHSRLSLFGFVDRFSTANLVNMNNAGMTSDYIRAEKRGFATFETRLELFHPAPRVGETVATTAGMLQLGKSSVKIFHEMHLQETGQLVARYYQAGVHFDLEARKSAPMPESLLARARQFLVVP